LEATEEIAQSPLKMIIRPNSIVLSSWLHANRYKLLGLKRINDYDEVPECGGGQESWDLGFATDFARRCCWKTIFCRNRSNGTAHMKIPDHNCWHWHLKLPQTSSHAQAKTH